MPHTDRPNLLFIMTDQLRHDWFGAAGADWVRTPNIDAIASRGVRFTQTTTPCPVCAPARISLASGLFPHRLGATDNSAYLPISTPTYYQRLRDHGYHVGCVGKLDLAKPDRYNGLNGDRPRTYGWGFTHPVEVEGKMHAGRCKPPKGPYTKWLDEQGLLDAFYDDYSVRRPKGSYIDGSTKDSVLPTEAFADVWIGRRAEQWLSDIEGDYPWHLFVSFVGPHDPFDPPTEYADQYRNADMPAAIPFSPDGKPDWIQKRAGRYGATSEGVAIARRQYSASTTAIDDAIGGIMKALEARGWADNTYIVFSADHGEMLGDFGMFTKQLPYEASMRIPLIVAGPGIEGGRTSDALVELEDVNPTLCEMAGVPALENIDARSILGVARGEVSEHRDATIAVDPKFRTLRTAEWKFIDNINNTEELYHLTEDPDELRNVVADQPEIARALRDLLRARLVEGEHLR